MSTTPAMNQDALPQAAKTAVSGAAHGCISAIEIHNRPSQHDASLERGDSKAQAEGQLPSIVSFSGGQTSGYMLRKLMEKHADFGTRFRVVFCNTGKEHDATLDFVHDVETKWGVPVTWLEYTRIPAIDVDPLLVPAGRKRSNLLRAASEGISVNWYRKVRWETAARRTDGLTPFDEFLEITSALPNVRVRSCSSELKIRVIRRWLYAEGVDWFNDFVGIRWDERDRMTDIMRGADEYRCFPKFPLCEDGTTRADVDAFWLAHPFRLNIPNYMGNCDLCFLKARWKREAITRRDPQAAKWWADWEKKFEARGVSGHGARFKSGETYEGLISSATHPELALGDESEEDVPCSCAVGGYRQTDEADE